jgi:amino acid transporter
MSNNIPSGATGQPVRGLARLFLRKSVEQMHAEHESSELKRSLTSLNLVSLGIGCIIGTGIFVLTGRAAADFAGPAIMISFIITGVLCTFVALCYSELASMLPVSGSAYSYSYASMGEVVAWVMGLLLVLEYGLAASTVAVGWSSYVVSLLHDMGRRGGGAGYREPACDDCDFRSDLSAGAGHSGVSQCQQCDRDHQTCGSDRIHWGGRFFCGYRQLVPTDS